MIYKKYFFIALAFGAFSFQSFSQAFNKKTIVITANIGAPHLYKGIAKQIVRSNTFEKYFSGKLIVSDFTGLNPISYKAEFAITKYFGLGLSGAMWNMSFSIKDNYNILHAGQITGTDEIDVYKFKITSKSFGIRPNLHIPFENPDNDLYLGFGLGFTSNGLNIDFSSTDVNKVFPNFDYDLSLPGGVYFAPTIGFRRYFNEYIGLNFELGYEKGAIVQGGLAIRLNHKVKPKEEKK